MNINQTSTIETFAGKWGVWKSTIAASIAIFHALEWYKTLAIDYDGGKAFARVIQFPFTKTNSIEETHINNLSFSSIQPIDTLKKRSDTQSFSEYISQFPEDYWLVAFNDMLHEFFGASTEVATLHKYISLVTILHEAKKQWFQKIILDIEPTIGLQRLITSTETVSRSLENLSKKWRATLTALWAAGWWDIKSFLQSPYIKNVDQYVARIKATKDMIQSAQFSIISIPEPEPLSQALWEVLSIIQMTKWKVHNIILNNYWRLSQHIETNAHTIAAEKSLEIWAILKIVPHTPHMFDTEKRISTLQNIGSSLSTVA